MNQTAYRNQRRINKNQAVHRCLAGKLEMAHYGRRQEENEVDDIDKYHI